MHLNFNISRTFYQRHNKSLWSVHTTFSPLEASTKNPAYGRHQISWPMRIGKQKRKKFNPERLLVLKALWVRPQVHQCTSWTPPMHEPSTGAIWINSSCLGLYESVDECTSPPVKHRPRVDDSCMQSGTTLLFRAIQVGWRVHVSTIQTPPMRRRFKYAIGNKSLFLGHQSTSQRPHTHEPSTAPRGSGWGGRKGGLTNDRPQTDHVIWGPIRGQNKNYMGRVHTYIHTDIATTRPNRPSGPIWWKFKI